VRTVLVVDPDPLFRKVLCSSLIEHGFPVIAAASYRDGIAALGREPEWIVLAARLPDGNGVEVLREARRRGMHVEGVVLANEGGAMDTMLELAPLRPEQTFMKPVEPKAIVDWIEGRSAGTA
jgi:DNA-binding response OmpR family regulator